MTDHLFENDKCEWSFWPWLSDIISNSKFILSQLHISAICKTPSVHQRWVAKKGTGPTENDIDRIYGKYLTTTEDVLANNSALISGL